MKLGPPLNDSFYFQVDLKHIDQEKGSNVVDVGIDLKEYYLSVEWDILAVPATRSVVVNLKLLWNQCYNNSLTLVSV